jgi:hypothetical protein
VTCKHTDFSVTANVKRLTNSAQQVDGHLLELQVQCAQCKTQFRFLGLPRGLNLNGATVSLDATELFVAISPDGSRNPSPLQGFALRGPKS